MIEIKELVIKATVSQGDANVASAPASPSASEGPGGQDTLQEYVEQVMQILDDKKER